MYALFVHSYIIKIVPKCSGTDLLNVFKIWIFLFAVYAFSNPFFMLENSTYFSFCSTFIFDVCYELYATSCHSQKSHLNLHQFMFMDVNCAAISDKISCRLIMNLVQTNSNINNTAILLVFTLPKTLLMNGFCL